MGLACGTRCVGGCSPPLPSPWSHDVASGNGLPMTFTRSPRKQHTVREWSFPFLSVSNVSRCSPRLACLSHASENRVVRKPNFPRWLWVAGTPACSGPRLTEGSLVTGTMPGATDNRERETRPAGLVRASAAVGGDQPVLMPRGKDTGWRGESWRGPGACARPDRTEAGSEGVERSHEAPTRCSSPQRPPGHCVHQ